MTPNRWWRYSAASFSKLSGYVRLGRRKMGRSASTGGGVLRTMVAGAGAGTTATVTLAGAPGSVTTTSSPGSVGRSTGGRVTLALALVWRLPSPSGARLG